MIPDNAALLIHDAIAAVCPIDSVSIGSYTDSTTWSVAFSPSATPQQIAAANALIPTIVVADLRPTVLSAAQFQARFTQLEQGAIWAAAAKDTTGSIGAGLTLGLTAQQIDLTDAVLKAWMDGLVLAGAITSQRETEILTP